MIRSLQHTKEEFKDLLAWMEENGKNIGVSNDPHIIVKALKFSQEMSTCLTMSCGGVDF